MNFANRCGVVCYSARVVGGLAALAICAGLAAGDPPPDPAALWLFDEAIGASSFQDEDGNYPGTKEGTGIVRTSYRGNALYFAGESEFASISGAESLLTGDSWSVSLWYRQNTQTSGGSRLRTMFAAGDAGTTGIAISVERGNVSNLQFRIGASEIYLPFPWDPGWHHVVLVRDGATGRSYVDGELLGTFPAGTPTVGTMRLGRDNSSQTSRVFKGYIDEVGIYDTPLTPEEVRELYIRHPLPPKVSVPYVSDFAGGDMGFYCIRIPSILRASDGALLAFAEARLDNCQDHGNINTVVRRSTDNGDTWGPIITVWDDGPNTAGNPCPVLDRDTGRIWMINTHNLGQDSPQQIFDGTSEGGRTVWVCYSDDHGFTWTSPIEITETVKLPEWRWYATGPGVSIQDERGRLIVPATRNMGLGPTANAFVFHSDDHGQSWNLTGGMAGDQISEPQVVELANQQLMLNTRRTGDRPLFRAVARSNDRGVTWGPVMHNFGLPSSGVQGSILRYSLATQQDANRIIFSNPANNESASANSRTRMTVRISLDEGQIWTHGRELHYGWSAYSSLVVTDDFQVGCLYEWGTVNRYETFVFERMSLEWLTRGAESAPAVTLPPANVVADYTPEVGAVVMWDAVEGASGYQILRYQAGQPGTASVVATVEAGETSWEDTDLESMAGYYYRLRGINSAGLSHDSQPAFISTAPAGVLLVPAFYPTIEGAVMAASDGDEIRVASNHTDRSHSVDLQNKDITIRSYAVGEGQP